ncbi:TetR family transcriptional regulator [Propionibacteriaceae bacterium ES.041]|uniref:TetR family transcriptional regulator n=1 Tax=Enemella evansiae TaxID=2016499 RepID=UPI000B96CFE3|nr:TetR family transcriptional regulator [Enemella evansiae]OYO15455.1 TetR family transcriptional regulator [Enemella evansiae]PFG67185.1 TetR family transcriptional regulator [Propionibacteriaceae bacterium ES.041]
MTGESPRDLLLHKAVQHFATHGVRDTSLRTLASNIGTSQRMLSYHFGSREGLLAAVIERIAAANADALAQLFTDHQDPFDAGAENWRRTADQAQLVGPLYFELSAHAMYGKVYAESLRAAVLDQAQERFAEAYARRTDEATARTLARLTLAVGQGLLFDMLLDGDRAASDRAVEEFTAMIRQRLAG